MLDGRYKLTRIIGIGGMAVVYEADDLAMDRKVAVKMLKDEIKEDIQEVKRFINESKAVAMLSHPNIVHIYDVSVKSQNNSHYIVMEMIDGITLKDYIVKKGRLGWREAISYAEQVLNALNHAHGRGIIHRDVKPQNVMLLRNGNLKITDFGIAKMQGSEPLTMTNKAIGTVHYISPEQANGTGVTNVSDIYSTGVLLYEMSTGKLPFDGENAINIAMKQVSDPPRNPRELNPEIPKGLSQIILKAMNKAPRDRYQSAGDMIKQLSILSANPAVVFNYAAVAHNPANGSNLPVLAETGAGKIPQLIDNSSRAIRPVAGVGKIQDIDKIDEDEMRRKGRNPKKGIRRRSSKSMLPIISGVTLAFLIVLGVSAVNIIMLFMDNAFINPADDTVTIPNFVGRTAGEIAPQMEELRLVTGNIELVTNDDFEAGQIISQEPRAEQVRRFAPGVDRIQVDFVISRGRDTYTVEDLSILQYIDVQLMLRTRRIEFETFYEPHDTIPSGFIIFTEPGPGILMKAGDVINLYVSSGQEIQRAIMPDLIRRSEADARRILADEQIMIRRIDREHSEVVPAGHVIDQDITPFRDVPRKSTRVILRISLGPRPTEPPPETDAPTEE
jgi:serine/threonine-protein kinase